MHAPYLNWHTQKVWVNIEDCKWRQTSRDPLIEIFEVISFNFLDVVIDVYYKHVKYQIENICIIFFDKFFCILDYIKISKALICV
jgi:hypothetical protein